LPMEVNEVQVMENFLQCGGFPGETFRFGLASLL
jgi:hypothetical protein